MKSEWKVSHTYAGGEMFIQVYRLRDTERVDCSGNRETAGPIFSSDEDAEAYADLLNEKQEVYDELTHMKSILSSYISNDFDATGGDGEYIAQAISSAGADPYALARYIDLSGILPEKNAVVCHCPMCGGTNKIRVDKEKLDRYRGGNQLIQDVFPELNPMEREFLKTGYCPECQRTLFGSCYSSDLITGA